MRKLTVLCLSLAAAPGCVTGDFNGLPIRPGVPARPSAAARVKTFREHVDGRSTHRAGPSAWYPRGRAISRRWSYIIIHHSGTDSGGAARFDKFHREQNGWDELGYHFVIGNGTDTPDGYVEVGSRWLKQKHGAHCKTPGNYFNKHGIGICLVGDFTNSRPTRRQMASLRKLVGFLCRECRISVSHVTTHGAVTGRTECPGEGFNLAWLRRSVSSGTGAASR